MEHYILRIEKTDDPTFEERIKKAFPKKVCPKCGRELPLGAFRGKDYALRYLCHECAHKETKKKKKKKK